jgi:hypothetical protein
MRGAIPLPTMYAYMGCMGTTLPLPTKRVGVYRVAIKLQAASRR